jgi:hypothetical protein
MPRARALLIVTLLTLLAPSVAASALVLTTLPVAIIWGRSAARRRQGRAAHLWRLRVSAEDRRVLTIYHNFA